NAVAHPAIVGTYDKIDRLGRCWPGRRQALRNAATRRGSNPQVNQQEQGERTKQPRTTLLETESGEILSSANRVVCSDNAKLTTRNYGLGTHSITAAIFRCQVRVWSGAFNRGERLLLI